LYPRKGTIAVGADADIVIWDPTGRTRIGIDHKHHMNMDYSAYEGMDLAGRVETVISRGQIIIDQDRYLGTVGHGQYLPRDLSKYLI
jgi:dihydropyrimidinase